MLTGRILVNCTKILALLQSRRRILYPATSWFQTRIYKWNAMVGNMISAECHNEVSYGCRLSLQDRGRGRALGQRALCFTPTAGHLRPTVGSVCVWGGSLGTAPSPRSGARHCVKGPSGRPLRKPILANGSLQEGASSCKILELPGSQVSWLNIFLLHVWPAWSIICFLYIIHIPQRPEMLGATRKDCCPLWWVGHIFKEARSWGLSLVCASLAP